MLVRQARRDEADTLAVILRVAMRTAMPFLPELHTPEEDRWFVREIVFSKCDVWVAELEGRIMGFIAVGDELVEHLYVLPDHQGAGIGTALLERAKELRPAGFRLWVFQRNTGARSFYEARGLKLVELTDGAANEEREPDALYEWRCAELSPARAGAA
jgi:putative acetyltransferase